MTCFPLQTHHIGSERHEDRCQRRGWSDWSTWSGAQGGSGCADWTAQASWSSSGRCDPAKYKPSPGSDRDHPVAHDVVDGRIGRCSALNTQREIGHIQSGMCPDWGRFRSELGRNWSGADQIWAPGAIGLLLADSAHVGPSWANFCPYWCDMCQRAGHFPANFGRIRRPFSKMLAGVSFPFFL